MSFTTDCKRYYGSGFYTYSYNNYEGYYNKQCFTSQSGSEVNFAFSTLQHIISVGFIPGSCPQLTEATYSDPATCYPNSLQTHLDNPEAITQVDSITSGAKIITTTFSEAYNHN